MKQENLAQQFITIGELAKRSGVSVSTIRFYEEKQLIWSIRTNGNQRRYVRAMLRRIAIIKVAQLVGISLEEVKQAFSVLPDRKMASKQDWEKMSNLWKNQLEEKIQTLLQIRQQLDWCIDRLINVRFVTLMITMRASQMEHIFRRFNIVLNHLKQKINVLIGFCLS